MVMYEVSLNMLFSETYRRAAVCVNAVQTRAIDCTKTYKVMQQPSCATAVCDIQFDRQHDGIVPSCVLKVLQQKCLYSSFA